MNKEVQFICSDNFNVPVLDNIQGSLLNVLSACLVDGLALPSINAFTVELNQDGTPTGTTKIQFNTGHQLKLLQYIQLTRFSPDTLNGKYRVIGVPTPNTVVIANVVQSTQIGSALIAPLGFEKLFSASGKAVFRNQNPLAIHRPCLRVDDSLDPVYSATYAKYAKVGVLSDCADLDDVSMQVIPLDVDGVAKNWVGTGSGDAVINGWARWYYARSASAYSSAQDNTSPANGARPWLIIGSEDAFYLINPLTPSTSDTYKIIYGFGVLDGAQVENPAFLLATLNTTTVATSLDLSIVQNGVPLHSRSKPALIAPLKDAEKHSTSLPTSDVYTSGDTNTYSNPFVVDSHILQSSNFIVGVLPFLRRILKERTDPQFSTVIYDDTGYMIDLFMRTNRFAFDLGGVNADL